MRKKEPFFCPYMSSAGLVEVMNGKKVPFKAGAICARWVKGTCRDCEVAEEDKVQDLLEGKDG
jgi:hypothetical protein